MDDRPNNKVDTDCLPVSVLGAAFTFSAAAYNLVRLPKLIAETG